MDPVAYKVTYTLYFSRHFMKVRRLTKNFLIGTHLFSGKMEHAAGIRGGEGILIYRDDLVFLNNQFIFYTGHM
jgi:hypothetical protein